MIPIHFSAIYQPDEEEFCVSIKMGEDREISEQMSVPRFISFARDSDSPMVVGGTTITFEDGGGDLMKPVWDYFKSVADSYTNTAWETPININNN